MPVRLFWSDALGWVTVPGADDDGEPTVTSPFVTLIETARDEAMHDLTAALDDAALIRSRASVDAAIAAAQNLLDLLHQAQDANPTTKRHLCGHLPLVQNIEGVATSFCPKCVAWNCTTIPCPGHQRWPEQAEA